MKLLTTSAMALALLANTATADGELVVYLRTAVQN
jgi:spermidine/putrescine transport system substrate-binding protein